MCDFGSNIFSILLYRLAQPEIIIYFFRGVHTHGSKGRGVYFYPESNIELIIIIIIVVVVAVTTLNLIKILIDIKADRERVGPHEVFEEAGFSAGGEPQGVCAYVTWEKWEKWR